MAGDWVFGKKEDLIVFSGPILVALAINLLIQRTGIDLSITVLFAHYFLNIPHVYSTYWHAFGYEATRKDHMLWLVFIPAFFMVASTCMYYYVGREMISLFLAHFAAWHFLKQQNAWFFIAQGKVSRAMKYFSKNAIHAVTYGFFFASLCESEHRPWYREGDLVMLRDWAHQPLLFWSYGSAAAYVIVQAILWKKNGKTNWAANNLFLAAAVVWWMSRLGPALDGSFFLTHTAHALPYLYLGYRYVRSKKSFGNIRPALLFSFIYIGAFALSFLDIYSRSTIPEEDKFFAPLIITIASLAFTHFTFDMFLWNRKHNPDWIKALGSVRAETKKPEESPPAIAA